MNKEEMFQSLAGRLIVSVQALPGNPLRDVHCIAKLAAAAIMGGAAGIRANGAEDLAAIRSEVSVPLLGIQKKAPSLTEPYITPDIESALAIAPFSDIIAVDATFRPDRTRAPRLIAEIKKRIGKPVMADISNFEEGMAAAEAGADIVATTLSGYTQYTIKTAGPDFELISRLSSAALPPVIGEGRFLSAADIDAGFEAGAFAIVIGKLITNAMFITNYLIQNSKRLRK